MSKKYTVPGKEKLVLGVIIIFIVLAAFFTQWGKLASTGLSSSEDEPSTQLSGSQEEINKIFKSLLYVKTVAEGEESEAKQVLYLDCAGKQMIYLFHYQNDSGETTGVTSYSRLAVADELAFCP